MGTTREGVTTVLKPTDPRYIKSQYRTSDKLEIIAETHRRFGVAQEDIFLAVTRKLLEVKPRSVNILDIGAGTGSWYKSVRSLAGSMPHYTGIDQSDGMVERLKTCFNGDPNARALVGDAQSLDFDNESFDCVGMHFVLYFLADMRAGLMEAWRLLKPTGVLVCATNVRRPHRELWDLQEQAVQQLGLAGTENTITASDRFHLDNGAEFFPKAPVIYRWAAGFRFDDPEAVVRYVAAGPIRKHLGDQADNPEILEQTLGWIRSQVSKKIAEEGAFTVGNEVGFFLVEKWIPSPLLASRILLCTPLGI